MNARLRGLILIVEEFGGTVVAVRQNRHFVLRVAFDNGIIATLTTSVSPSDVRAAENFRRDVKRAKYR